MNEWLLKSMPTFFGWLDKNKDGQLSESELKKVSKRVSLKVSKADFKKIDDAIDTLLLSISVRSLIKTETLAVLNDRVLQRLTVLRDALRFIP